MNCMNHLLNDNAVISLRTRTFKSRLLNKAKVEQNETLLKFLNVAMPILIVGILGIIMFIIRKRKYSKTAA